jgi:hypothetical protein
LRSGAKENKTHIIIMQTSPGLLSMTSWPSGLRRYVKAVVFTGVGSNPIDVTFLFWSINTIILLICSSAASIYFSLLLPTSIFYYLLLLGAIGWLARGGEYYLGKRVLFICSHLEKIFVCSAILLSHWIRASLSDSARHRSKSSWRMHC